MLPLVTSVPTPSTVDSGSVLYKINALMNYCLLCYRVIPLINPLYLHSYRNLTSLSFCPLLLLICMSSMIPSWISRENSLFTILRESPTFSFSEIACFCCISSVRCPLFPSFMGSSVDFCCVCSLRFLSANSLLDIKVACISYFLYTHLWAVYTKFEITRNGTCDVIM